jgi:GMP synthase (glutamine-hydrolysing)
MHQAIGKNYTAFFVNGLLRKNDSRIDQYKGMGLNVKGVDAGDRFLSELAGLVIQKPNVKLLDVFLSKF